MVRAQAGVMHWVHTLVFAPYQALANRTTQFEMLPVVKELFEFTENILANPDYDLRTVPYLDAGKTSCWSLQRMFNRGRPLPRSPFAVVKDIVKYILHKTIVREHAPWRTVYALIHPISTFILRNWAVSSAVGLYEKVGATHANNFEIRLDKPHCYASSAN